MTSRDPSVLVRDKMGSLNFGGSDDQTDRLVIGLDFGTTYSGYVNAQSSPVQSRFGLPQQRKLIA